MTITPEEPREAAPRSPPPAGPATAATVAELDPEEAPTAPAATAVGMLGGALLERGATIGRYVVLSRLGSGGMGVVYAAYDPELDRKVALKLLKAGQGDAAGRARLLREAQAMAKLAHPNVVAVHDVGTVDDQVFIAMEFVQGTTLSRWLWQKPRSWAQIVELSLAVGRGLAAAHRAGLVHRDLKPENVMVGDDGRVRVMDFGLARVDGRALAGSTPLADSSARPREAALDLDLTRTGAMLGTPMYMAPEQWEGGETDPRTDQFAFCVVLWEALYGERPFGGGTVAALSHAVTNGIISAPSDPSRAPPWLRRALERGMTLIPDERWPSMDALLAELGRDRRSPLARIALAGAVGLALILAVVGLARLTPPAAGPGVEVAALERRIAAAVVAQAHESGARGHWVYGGADEPADTSFVRLRVLEGLGGAGAREAASELRRRLFRSLADLGDHYWEKPGGRSFAADFYAQACLFAFARGDVLVIDDAAAAATALERSGLTPPELARLLSEAAEGSFSPVEIESAEELAALAEPASLEAATPAPLLPPCPSGMALVEGGELRGRAIDDLCVDVTEVTAGAYQRCLSRGACTPTDTHELNEHCTLGAPGGARLPINCVDWNQARAYCAAAGKRLPSELEWEWAARGGDEARPYPWGHGPARCGLAIMRSGGGDGCGQDRAARVGSRPDGDSRHGLKDMVGNVWEWTSSADGDRRVLRGGGWMEGDDASLRVSARLSFRPSYSSFSFGLRCVRAPRAAANSTRASSADPAAAQAQGDP
ncbi:MAG: SUMF1/EgtB/PvdO family nonheme iron enzyme [Myxococcales bacterium]|nr:SUMF1/EgtB/PvdO family nonheme iron enzyme [Myxococcales bacterium]